MKTLLHIIIMITFSGMINPMFGQGLQNSESYFNNSADLFIDNKHDEALNIINDGLNQYPNDPKLTALAKLINEEKQDQEQQKKDQEKKEQEEKEKKEQDKEQKKEEQEKEQQDKQEQEQNQDQSKQQEKQQQKQPPQQITKQDAEQMLDALKDNEKKTLEKVKLQQMKNAKGKKIEKDW